MPQAKRPHFESRIEAHHGAGNLLVLMSLPVLLPLGRRGAMGVSIPDVLQSTASSSSSSVMQVGMLFHFLDQSRIITSNRFVLNMGQGHHLQPRLHPPLFCNLQQFIIKTAAAHHPISQKEVDELLVKGVLEPSSSDASFYSSVFVFHKCIGGLQPILNLKQFNCHLCITCFKMPIMRHAWQFIQHGDYAFCIDLKDTYLHIPIVKHHHHHHFFIICLEKYTISVESFTFWAGHNP